MTRRLSPAFVSSCCLALILAGCSEKPAPPPPPKPPPAAEVKALWDRMIGAATRCDNAYAYLSSQLDTAVAEAQAGRVSDFSGAATAAQTSELICDNARNEVAQLTPPPSSAGENKAAYTRVLQGCADAYGQRAAAAHRVTALAAEGFKTDAGEREKAAAEQSNETLKACLLGFTDTAKASGMTLKDLRG